MMTNDKENQKTQSKEKDSEKLDDQVKSVLKNKTEQTSEKQEKTNDKFGAEIKDTPKRSSSNDQTKDVLESKTKQASEKQEKTNDKLDVEAKDNAKASSLDDKTSQEGSITNGKLKAIRADSLVKHPRKKLQNRPQNQARRSQRRNQHGGNRRGAAREQEFDEKVVHIARVTNVVKGGRRFSFSALVVIGDKKGRVAYGQGKAKEVPEAIKKAIKKAKRDFIKVPIIDKRTIPHIIQAKFVSSEVLLKPATKGRGIIASGAVRSVVELAGYSDIVTKSIGSSNKRNTVKATIKALKLLRTAQQIRELKGLEKGNHEAKQS